MSRPNRFKSGRTKGGRFHAGRFIDVTSNDPGAPAPNITEDFGALTRQGAGGIAVTGTSISSGDPSGHWQIVSNVLSPSATGEDALTGTYNLTMDDGQTATLTILADTYSALTDKTEIEATHTHAVANRSALDSTCSVREGTTADVIDISGHSFTGSFTLSGEGFATNSAIRPSGYDYGVELGGIIMDGENVHVEQLEIYAPKAGARAGDGAIGQTTTITNCSITKCEIHSTPMETHVEQMRIANDPEVAQQVVGIRFNTGGSNVTVEDCFLHDLRTAISGNIDNFQITGCESEDTTEGWIGTLNTGATGIIIKNCEHIGVWSVLADPLDQHSGLGGGSLINGETGCKGQIIGCVVSNGGWRRRDYEVSQGRPAPATTGTTGFKLNDPNPVSTNGYDGWVIKHCLWQVETQVGMLQENGKNIDWAYITMVGDPESGAGSPNIQIEDVDPAYTDTTNVRIWKTLTGGGSYNALNTDAERRGVSNAAYDNIQIINGATVQSGVTEARAYDEYFVGDATKGLEKLTPAEMIDAFEPQAWTHAKTANVGAINSYYTIGIPGKGSTDTSPAYDQPTSAGSATANGHAYDRTVWDGTVGLELSSDPTHGTALTSAANTLVPNGKQLLVIGQVELAAGTGSTTMSFYNDGSGGINIERAGPYNYLSFEWRRASDNLSVLRFDTLSEVHPDDGRFSFAMSADLDNDRICVAINGKAVTAFNRFTSARLLNNDTGDWQANSVHLLETTAGANRFEGTLDFFGVDNSFVDLETDAGLETLFAADGTLLDLTSNGYLIALAGNAAAFNGGTGNANGAAQAVTTNGAGTVADAGGDVTAPVLSSPAASKDGTTGATGISVSTDEGNGTLYWGIYPTASTPSAADVVAGTGATVNGSQAVSGTGTQNVSDQTGLTAATAYKAHFVHDDAAANRSNLATSAEFTTDAPAGFAATLGVGGGTFTVSGGFNVWEGANGDQLVVTSAGSPSGLELVGGGGGGGHRAGGGGGAGELVQITSGVPAFTTQTYTANVGAGGAGDTSGTAPGASGGNTRIVGGSSDDVTQTALGGGGGGTVNAASDNGTSGGNDGGSGGGTCSTNQTTRYGRSVAVDGVGNDGGNGSFTNTAGGGGGGSAAVGGAQSSGVGGSGGAGTASVAPGKGDTLAAGGDAGDNITAGDGANGVNFGDGGEGGSEVFGQRDGGAGANGIVRIWWPV